MANMTSTLMATEPLNVTSDPYNYTLSAGTTDYSGIVDTSGHNFWARIGYYYPLRITEAVVGLSGNLMVIIAVGRHEDLQTATGSLLANLAAADCVGASLTAMSIIGETMERTSRWLQFCVIKEILYIIGGFGNILSLTMISVDRLICMSTPFWYKANMTVSKVLPCQIIVWIGIVLHFSLVYTLRSTATLSIPTCFYAFILSTRDMRWFILYPYYCFTVITIINNIIMSIMVWRQGRQIAAQSVTAANHMMQRQRKVTKTTSLVLLGYLALTLPNAIINVMLEKDTAASVHIQYVALILWHMNSAINPFIYAFRMPRFLQAFRRMLGLKSNAVAPAPAPGTVQVGAPGGTGVPRSTNV